MQNLNQLTLHQSRELLRKGACSSRQLVERLIEEIRSHDPQLRAYINVDEEQALQQAQAADARRQQGQAAALLGLPIAVKDAISVIGQPCTCASQILQGYQAPYDASAIARLRAAGAVFLGRTNMDEFAMGSSTENSAMQITRNPWDIDRVPGGSSGGSSAAVAADEAIAALGSDTGGSIRLPASFCGCVGLKPSYGRVSRYGLTAFASSLDQIGPMTKDVRDAAIILNVIAGHDPCDTTSAQIAVPDFESALQPSLAGVKVGLPREYFTSGIDPEVQQIVQEAIGQCERLGATLIETSLPMTSHAIAVYHIIACAEASANLARFDGVRYGQRAPDVNSLLEMYTRTRSAGFGSEVKRRIILGTYVLSSGYYDAYYLHAQKARTLIRREFDQVFQACDVLLTPVAPIVAYRIGEKNHDPLQMYLVDIFMAPASLAGLCALSLPCGFTSAGLPVGLQVIGPAFGEERILRVGYAYEQSTEWHRRKPISR